MPSYAQHGSYTVPVTLSATYTPPGDGDQVTTSVTRNLVFNVLNANGAPVFDAAEVWNILEGQPLRISVFAFDPDNPGFEPKIRLTPTGPLSAEPSTDATVSYQVTGLPEGARFDPDTLEIVWTPGYAQAGSYAVTVTATDDGDAKNGSSGTPAVSSVTLPIIVTNANRAPDIGDVSNAFVAKGAVLEIPVSAVDADGNPVQLTFSGLPRFASYTQNPSPHNGAATTGTLRFAPGVGDRGDYAITVVAQDNGDGNVNQVLTQAKTFVLTVQSATEAPVISMPRQVAAVVGQALSVPIYVGDLDQDALSYSAVGLPTGAVITPQAQYGQAVLTWIPSAGDIGVRDIEIAVTDSGLGPQDAGFQPGSTSPVPNVTKHTLRVLVRDSNASSELLGVQVNSIQLSDTGNAATPVHISATEGSPLTIDLFGRDTDTDLISWSSANLPRGMTLEVPAAGNGNRAVLHWTPDLFAALDSNLTLGASATPGLWRFSVQGSDGVAQFARTFEVSVANFNQAPRILPMPLQLVSEGETMSFTLRTFDADQDSLRTSLLSDADTPAGVSFDSATGYFEWTPNQDTVNNAAQNDRPFVFTFQTTDGTATASQSVQVRVFDVNRVPRLSANNHAVLVGQTLSIPVQLGANLTNGANQNGIVANDDDGAAQTQALTVSFTGLPEGASYDAQTKRLNWTPGPSQVGDFVIFARVSDGKNTTTRSFTVRSVADSEANAPKILVSTTPSTPVLPGQSIVATVRADAFSGIATLAVQMRSISSADGATSAWQSVALDGAGRVQLAASLPGLLELRVSATDLDGFSSSQTQTIRVKDPADTQAPVLAWTGSLAGANLATRPVSVTELTGLQISLQEAQLMGYKLEIAPAIITSSSGINGINGINGDINGDMNGVTNNAAWITLAQQAATAANSNLALTLATLDPAQLANGAYQLRLSAWDLMGRTTTIDARVVVDTAQKTLSSTAALDQTYTVAGHSFAMLRRLDNSAGLDPAQKDFGNWRIPALDTGLTHDQISATASGATAPWSEGAQVWLSAPDLAAINTLAAGANSAGASSPISLRFKLATSTEPLGSEIGAPSVLRPVFAVDQGWTLEASSQYQDGTPQADTTNTPEMLVRQGRHLYSQLTGLPWVPTGFTLTGPDGSRYTLDGAGKVSSVRFADGAQWLVSDAGIAGIAANAASRDPADRLDFIRDTQGRITRITGIIGITSITGPGDSQSSDANTTVYRYDSQSRLILARNLSASDLGTPYGYDANGQLFTDRITANLGAAVHWTNGTDNQWAGSLQSGQTTTLAFAVRDSELASSVRAPGAAGAIIIAIESQLSDPAATLQVTGVTVLGSNTVAGVQTTLVRVTEAGLKLIRLQGTGQNNSSAQIRISVAGDINRDGVVDGADSAAWVQAAATNAALGDLNGDAVVNSTDRQVLYANYGFKTNQAPVAAALLPTTLTHADLATTVALASVAQDLDGDQVLWRVVAATHGSARLSSDGQSISFIPDAHYSGMASISVQADDGFAASSPIVLSVNVSAAKLLRIRLTNLEQLSNLRMGEAVTLQATGDFEDQTGVALAAGSYLTVQSANIAAMGYVGSSAVQVQDATDRLRATCVGAALIRVSHSDPLGHTVSAVLALNTRAAPVVFPASTDATRATDEGDGDGDGDGTEPFIDQPDVYPGTLALTPGGTRQLKVQLLDANTGAQTDIHSASQTLFAGTPESVAFYLDPATQQPLLDPVTGEIQFDPDTGEVLLDPNTGESVQVIIPAAAPVYSGTRYFSSDETIASVSADGLITALREGLVTVSIVHLASAVDGSGQISQQVLGQTDITLNVQAAQLTDNDDATSAPRSMVVAKDVGGVVASATGETVMIGAGALPADTAVSIARIELADMASLPGLAIPGAGVLQLAGAFKLDLGRTASSFPVQLAVPLQAGITAEAGTEVLFFRKGQVITADGSFKPTWWLVDNGFVGADGVARTASPPYGGVDTSGEYMVCRRLPGVIGGVFNLGIGGGGWADFGNFSLGGGLSGVNIQSEVIGILASQSSAISGGSYKFGVPQFSQNIVIPTIAVNDTFTLNLQDFIPPVASPYGNVVLPNVSDASVNDAGEMHISIDNPNPGQFTGSIVLRMRLPDGSTQDVQTFAGDKTGDVIITPPAGIAVGSVSWQLVRLVPQEVFTGSGELSGEPPAEFAGNTLRISPKPLMVAVLNRTGVAFFRENKPVGSTTLVGTLGQPNNFGGQTITGTKVQPVTYSDDLTRVYVAGNGVIYVIDTLTYKLLDPIYTYGGNIVSLASTGGLLFIGEGNSYGSGASNARLMVMSTIPGSKSYNKPITLKGTGIEATPLGIAGMAVGPDGKNLVVAVPKQRNSVTLGDPNKRGDVLVFNIDSLDLKTGKIDAPVKAQLPADSSGKAPQTITATEDPTHFLVADVADYNKGLATLVLTRDKDGSTSAAKMTAIALSQPGGAVRLDRLDIQRAQSAVLVTYQVEEYAIVADDNYNFLDPYWRAMFEAPMFSQLSPSGPPTAIGGSASAKKVNVGGKLGIVKDPFGSNPQFMGATLPLDGYGIVNLSLSPDNSVLIGQLKGGYGTADPFHQKDNQNHAWNVGLLLQAAIDLPEQDRMSKHIALPASAELLLPSSNANAGGYLGAPIGTFFDDEPKISSVQGNMGDIIEVDLREQAARAMLGYSATTAFAMLTKQQQENVMITKAGLSQFTISKATQDSLSLDNGLADNNALKLVMGKTVTGESEIYSRTQPGGLAKGDFKDSGILYLRPNLTQPDEDKLRQGMHLDTDKSVTFSYEFKETSDDKVSFEWKKGLITVTAKDFINSGARVFFGDRPLENPGYSAFTLSGEVSLAAASAKTIDSLDVYRVEQRLRYLGYGLAPAAITGAGEVTVDGNFSEAEAADLKLFEKVVRYTSATGTGTNATTPVNGVIVEIQYRASIIATQEKADLKEVVGSLRIISNANNLTGTALTTAINSAKSAATVIAKTNALAAAHFTTEADIQGMDGKIEGEAKNEERVKTLSWLNAYNAPHWLQFGDIFTEGTKLTGWVNKLATNATGSMGTSWVYDLMVAGQNAASKQGRTVPLWFAGAGPLSVQLNLGINTAYVSQQNQAGIYADEFMLGLSDSTSVDLSNVTASNNTNAAPQQKLKYLLQERDRIRQAGNGTWDAARAQELADLLKYVNRINPAANNPNNQAEALKDFLAVYTATQNDSVTNNGSLDEQLGLIKSSGGNAVKSKQIQELLFGTGTQINGLINSNELLIGGQGSTSGGINAQLTAQTLGAIMGRKPEDVAAWVAPINEAITKFDINTPKRLAAFLANVRAESGDLRTVVEGVGWSAAALKNVGNFNRLAITEPSPTVANYATRLAYYNAHHAQDMITYNGYLNGTLGVGSSTGEKQANYAYSGKDGNGNEASGDGYLYRGRGLLQITRNGKYERVTNGGFRAGGSGQANAIPGLNQIYGTQDDFVANPDQILTKTNSARSSTWYWRYESVQGDLNIRADANQFEEIVKGIHGGLGDLANRREFLRRVNDVIGDQNTYSSITQMLGIQGFNAKHSNGYNTQFGIVLKSRTPTAFVTPSNLMALDADARSQMPDSLVNQLVQDFEVNPKELDMLLLDVGLPNTGTPVVLAVSSPAAQKPHEGLYGTVGACAVAFKAVSDGVLYIRLAIPPLLLPGDSALQIFEPYAPLPSPEDDLYTSPQVQDEVSHSTKTTVLEQPKHGRLVWLGDKGSEVNLGNTNSYSYEPQNGYVGKDRVSFMTELAGRKIKVIYYIRVTDKIVELGNYQKVYEKYCPRRTWPMQGALELEGNLAAWQRTSDLSALLANATTSITGYQNLEGSSVAQTTGQGTTATIALDINAAGHNWFIDPTPLDNLDDYLPTSNPNIWQAKANTDAAGKMDMLSVLLHEYGHALGLAHSADADDFMATTLQPGERRLPSSQELSLMAQLVAQLKTPDTGNNPQTPTDPSVPTSPFDPLGAGLGFMAVGRLRRSSADSARAGSTTAADFAQYDTVANPSLVNGQFNSQFSAASSGWSTQGKVTVGSLSLGAGAATLAESSTSQTRLNQVFMVGPQDRFLSFTLSNLALDDATTGPDDAFEVGLLNANTGAALSGRIGLSNSDALLNLQPGSTGLEELAAQGVTHVSHGDGSRTYLVDLSGIARDANGKVAVNLSFDLIGFGATAASMGSQVQVSDVRLLGLPQTRDDSASGAEDSTLSIAVLSNDIDAAQPGFAPLVVAGPAHGSLSLNADGSFAYTPQANYFGVDSFTYQVTNARDSSSASSAVRSNISTVNLVISPVNDAPVAADLSLSTAEDTPVVIELLATDIDSDATSLAYRIQTQPQHGRLTLNPDGSYSYLANADFNGSDSFTYQVGDGELDSNLATVFITVTPVVNSN